MNARSLGTSYALVISVLVATACTKPASRNVIQQQDSGETPMVAEKAQDAPEAASEEVSATQAEEAPVTDLTLAEKTSLFAGLYYCEIESGVIDQVALQSGSFRVAVEPESILVKDAEFVMADGKPAALETVIAQYVETSTAHILIATDSETITRVQLKLTGAASEENKWNYQLMMVAENSAIVGECKQTTEKQEDLRDQLKALQKKN